jgi:hypothetical protein
MNWLRAPLRLVDDPANKAAPLAAALRDYGAERGDAQAVARLELQLGAALATPSAAASERAAPTWLFGLWALNAAIALALSWHAGAARRLDARAPIAQHATRDSGVSAVEIASRLGAGPRQLASQEAADRLQATLRR